MLCHPQTTLTMAEAGDDIDLGSDTTLLEAPSMLSNSIERT